MTQYLKGCAVLGGEFVDDDDVLGSTRARLNDGGSVLGSTWLRLQNLIGEAPKAAEQVPTKMWVIAGLAIAGLAAAALYNTSKG